MPVTQKNIVIPQSDNFRLVIQVNGGPSDLTGYVGEMQIREAKSSATAYADVTADAFTVVAGNRQVILELSASVTELYAWSGRAVYDLHIVGPGQDRWRLVEGVATLSKTVTR